jgi:hypothetical protein
MNQRIGHWRPYAISIALVCSLMLLLQNTTETAAVLEAATTVQSANLPCSTDSVADSAIVGTQECSAQRPCPTPTITPYARSTTGYIYSASNADTRLCPFLTDVCPVIVVLPHNTPVEIVGVIKGDSVPGRKGNYWRIILYQKQQLYVHSTFVFIPQSTATITPTLEPTVEFQNSNVNSAPSNQNQSNSDKSKSPASTQEAEPISKPSVIVTKPINPTPKVKKQYCSYPITC